jgi:hypothetical protein
MRAFFLVVVALHALIHILGFVKAFGIREIKELTLPISKPLGAIWLLAAALLLVYGVLYQLHSKPAWIIGLVGVIISQILFFYFWKDAKAGTLPNLLIVAALLLSYADSMFDSLVRKETLEVLVPAAAPDQTVLSLEETTHLPAPVQRWLVQCGAVGKPKATNGKVIQKALMKMKPEQKDWYPATAIQHTNVGKPAFIWSVDLKMNSFMWFKGRDKFQNGKGEMLIKMNTLVNIVNQSGEKIDEGSLQRFLGEMVWFPSLALSPYVKWEAIDDTSARATIAYQGATGSGTFYFDEKGNFTKFVALRFQGNEPDSERKEWILTVDDYAIFEGIKVPSKIKATWKLDSGEWTWLHLETTDIQYNVSEKL